MIRYRHIDHGEWILAHDMEYANLLPLPSQTSKRAHDGSLKSGGEDGKAMNWIPLTPEELAIFIALSKDLKEDNLKANLGLKDLEERNRGCEEIKPLKLFVFILQRRLEIERLDESCLPVLITTWRTGQYVMSSPRLHFGNGSNFLVAAMDLRNSFLSNRSSVDSVVLTLLTECTNIADLCSVKNSLSSTPSPKELFIKNNSSVTPEYLTEIFTPSNIDANKLLSYLLDGPAWVRTQTECLGACAIVSDMYQLLPGASISTSVFNQRIYEAKWLSPRQRPTTWQEDCTLFSSIITLPQVFAGIAMFESGTCNLDPSVLSEVFAMSSGNSLYVAGSLLCDPSERSKTTEIRRIVGNIGKAGVNFLIPPPEVRIREADPGKWLSINHHVFDGKFEDHFQTTSVHLSLTAYEFPLASEVENSRHAIDRSIMLVESLLSVYDGKDWVGEVDILKAVMRTYLLRAECNCSEDVPQQKSLPRESSSYKKSYNEVVKGDSRLAGTIGIENWDELIEAPDQGIIAVKAHGNWLARLAGTAFCMNRGFIPIIVPHDACWGCCAMLISQYQGKLRIALIC